MSKHQLDRIEEKLDMLIGMTCGSITQPQPPSSGGDPYFANVVSLLHFDGNLTDVKGNTWTASGNAAATGVAKFGSNSLAVDGVGDFIETPANTTLDLNGVDWTIEFWVYVTSGITYYRAFISRRHAGSPADCSYQIGLDNTSPGKLIFYNGSSLYVSGTNFPLDQWVFVQAVHTQATNNLKITVDGVTHIDVTADASALANSSPLYVGSYPYAGGAEHLAGRIDDLRITKGVARTSTVPTAAFPDA